MGSMNDNSRLSNGKGTFVTDKRIISLQHIEKTQRSVGFAHSSLHGGRSEAANSACLQR